MKKRIFIAFLLIATMSLMSVYAVTGSGAPSGSHFNLNLIGVKENHEKDMKNYDKGGHVIFVHMNKKTRIKLTEGDYAVLDKDGTDDGEAAFQLPSPDPNNDGVTEYSVYIRVLGKPGGKGTITTGGTNELGEEKFSSFPVSLNRQGGKQTFRNVSKELLYVYCDLDGDGDDERYPLFDDALQDYLWEFDNNGLKIVQLRFYEIPEDVN